MVQWFASVMLLASTQLSIAQHFELPSNSEIEFEIGWGSKELFMGFQTFYIILDDFSRENVNCQFVCWLIEKQSDTQFDMAASVILLNYFAMDATHIYGLVMGDFDLESGKFMLNPEVVQDWRRIFAKEDFEEFRKRMDCD